jgi:hypothetical protein
MGAPSGTDTLVLSGAESAPAGYYLLQVVLTNSYGISTGQVEVVHIYEDLTTTVEYVFTEDDFLCYRVTSAADSGPGSLRQVLSDVVLSDVALNGTPQTIELALAPGTVIELESTLVIDESLTLTIEGNGATLTRAASWTDSDTDTQLLRITDDDANAVIRRLHFKKGLATNNGGAISNSGILTLESCVFSGNQTTATSAAGGAVCSINTLTIRGCTFYKNTATNGWGGAVFFDDMSGDTLTMTGNLFYGNTASSYPVMYSAGTVIASYNVVDVDFGTGDSAKAGWDNAGTDTYITTGDPINPNTFAPKTGSPGITEIGIVSSPSADFPETDFYGVTRTFHNSAAGAVNQQ